MPLRMAGILVGYKYQEQQHHSYSTFNIDAELVCLEKLILFFFFFTQDDKGQEKSSIKDEMNIWYDFILFLKNMNFEQLKLFC